jgi:hypothetical protein
VRFGSGVQSAHLREGILPRPSLVFGIYFEKQSRRN